MTEFEGLEDVSPAVETVVQMGENQGDEEQRRRGCVMGASAPINTPSHAHAELARRTYLDYKHTTETKEVENEQVIPYSYKVVLNGEVIEVYEYTQAKQKVLKNEADEKPVRKKQEPSANEKQEEETKEFHRKRRTIYRTKQSLKRLINANVAQYQEKDKFITLTFADYLDRDEVIKRFKLFNKRLRYKINTDYQYIAVIERGTQGTKRLHLHTLFFGLPYIPADELADLWTYGTIDIKAIDDYNEIANYVLKYIEKTLTEDDYIPKGKRFYITSTGLKKPSIEYLDEGGLQQLLAQHEDKQCVYDMSFISQQNLERIKYYKFRRPHEKDKIWNLESMTPEQLEEYNDYMQEQEEIKKYLEEFGEL